MHHNLASKVEQEPLSFEGAGHACPFRSSILLVSGSCSVFPLHKPTRVGHQNLLPVPILSTLKSVVIGIVGRSYRQCFPDLRDPGQDKRSRYICFQDSPRGALKIKTHTFSKTMMIYCSKHCPSIDMEFN